MIIAATVICSLEIFALETKRKIEQLEQQQIINVEHERLARELHDGAIQKVYTAGLLVEFRLVRSDAIEKPTEFPLGAFRSGAERCDR